MHDDTNLLDLEDVTPQAHAPAGAFSTWLEDTLAAQRSGASIDVPCDACTACCTAAYFIHIAPEESETLRRIPKALLFPAPGWPKGHVVMGHDERGHCPMLVDGACSIYPHRPTTCRRYDCRVFAATGLAAGGPEKRGIDARSRRWRFSYPAVHDHAAHDAVRAAAQFLETHAHRFAEPVIPRNATQRALIAVKVFDVFLDRAEATDAVEATVAEITRRLRVLTSTSSAPARPA